MRTGMKRTGMKRTGMKKNEHHLLSDLHQLVSEWMCPSSCLATTVSSGRARTPQVLFAGSLAKFTYSLI